MARKKTKPTDWRKERRANEGSIRERNGKIYARIQFVGDDGKRHDKERQARNRKHARELIKEMRSELEAGGLKALVGPRMMFSELVDWYSENYVKDANTLTDEDRRHSQLRYQGEPGQNSERPFRPQATSRDHLSRPRKVQGDTAQDSDQIQELKDSGETANNRQR